MLLTKHLVKIENNIITESPQFFTAPDGTFHQDFYNNEDLLVKYGFDYELTEDEFNLYKSGKGFRVVNNSFEDVRSTDNDYKNEKAKEQQTALVELNYKLKAKLAYTGVICTIDETELLFQTNETALIMIASSITAFMNNESMTSICWKFWTVNKDRNYPFFVNLTKEQFVNFYNFALSLGAQAFSLEKEFNEIIQSYSTEELLDLEKITTFINEITESYSAISTNIGVIETISTTNLEA